MDDGRFLKYAERLNTLLNEAATEHGQSCKVPLVMGAVFGFMHDPQVPMEDKVVLLETLVKGLHHWKDTDFAKWAAGGVPLK